MQDYTFLDWQRIFLGDVPWLFTIEVLLRTGLMYGYALGVMRLMSKRGGSELSPFSLVIIIAMGSSVGDPMLYPDVPLLHGFAVLTAILIMERVLAEVTQRSSKAEAFVHGVPHEVIKHGRLDLEGISIESLSREELFAELRVAGVEQIGQVRQAYLEESAKMSVFLFPPDQVKPGLPIVPPWDIARPTSYGPGDSAPADGYYACADCGETLYWSIGQPFSACTNCESVAEWMAASEAGMELKSEEGAR